MEKFHCKSKLIAGAGAITALKEMNIEKLFLVCDPFFQKNGFAQKIVEAAGNPEYRIFSDIVPDPPVEMAARGAMQVKMFGPDAVIALGGGSTMDGAKAMAYFSGMETKLIAIPTTSGSGSEVTDFAILTHEGVKHPLVDEKIKPDVAILDSDLVATLPPVLIADGGFDLISHAMEAYVAANHSTISDLLAAEAFRAAMDGLQSSFHGDLDCRASLHTAATMAGIAFSQAGLGLCHAISHSLGGEFHTPHGRLNAILLPAVIEHNSAVSGHRYAQLARAAGLSSGSDTIALRALKNALVRLRKALMLPETLVQAGIPTAEVEHKMEKLVKAALNDPCCRTNSLRPDEAVIRSIIWQVAGRG